MVVGGGPWQVPLIRKAKEKGLFVLNTNLYPDSPGFAYSDAHEVADVLDVDRQLAIAREYRPNGIVTDQSDIALATVASLCESLGLPGIGRDKAELFTNKVRMRGFLVQNGFDTPQFANCPSPQSAVEFTRLHGYPVVIKPPANQASRGVFKANSDDALLGRYQEARSFARDGHVLVEQFLEGTELTVEGFKTATKHYSLAVSKKKALPNNPMVASELFYSPSTEGIDYKRLKSQHDRLVEEMGLPFGITHAEYIYSNDRFYLVEVAARGGGTKISSDIVPALSGVQTNELLISLALGEPVASLSAAEVVTPYAVLSFFNFEPGLVKSISGLESVRQMSGVLDIEMNFRVGDRIMAPADDRGRHGYFIALGASRSETESLRDRIHATVQLGYD
jgi:biotin carboxylase